MNFDAESKGQVDLACILMMVNSEVYSDDYNALKLAAILIIFGMAFSLDSRLYQLMVIKIAFAFSRDDDLHMTTDPLKDFSYNKQLFVDLDLTCIVCAEGSALFGRTATLPENSASYLKDDSHGGGVSLH